MKNIVNLTRRGDENKTDMFVFNAFFVLLLLVMFLACVWVGLSVYKSQNLAREQTAITSGSPSDINDTLKAFGMLLGISLGIFLFYKIFIETGVWKVLQRTLAAMRFMSRCLLSYLWFCLAVEFSHTIT